MALQANDSEASGFWTELHAECIAIEQEALNRMVDLSRNLNGADTRMVEAADLVPMQASIRDHKLRRALWQKIAR
jgi:hypothetical protein